MSPDDALAARRLLTSSKTATLSTLAARQEGPSYPFGSLVAVAIDAKATPLLLLSSLAEHTKNLAKCPRASLLFGEAGHANPLAAGRVTLLGDVVRAAEAELEAVRSAYLSSHPEAGAWSTFADFAFYVMKVVEVRYVAGFGKMGWIDPKELEAAT